MIPLIVGLIHIYPLYGLAVALYLAKRTQDLQTITEEILPEILAQAIESGLGDFRMETLDDPNIASALHFKSINMTELVANPKLVQGSLSVLGKYLYPTVVTIDGDAKGTFENAYAILQCLRSGKALNSSYEFKRSFVPSVSKINNGRSSQTVPKGTLFEAACSVITTLTPIKPAAWVEQQNTVIIPELPLPELMDFVELFDAMRSAELTEQLRLGNG